MTILIGHFGGVNSVAGTRHYLFGWAVFTVMMGLLLLTCGRWREEPPTTPATSKEPLADITRVRKWSPVVFATLGLLLVGIAPLVGETLLDSTRLGSVGEARAPGK